MPQGTPLPIAIIEQTLDEFGDAVLVHRGSASNARIEWTTPADAATHSFKALDPGSYFVVVQALTGPLGDRSDTTIEITAPTVVHPVVDARVTQFAQMLVNRTYTQSGTNYTITVTASQLDRQWQPYERIAGTWFCTLDRDDLFSFEVSNDQAHQQFMVVVWRLHAIDIEATEDRSLLRVDPSVLAGSELTVAAVTPLSARKHRWRVTSTGATPIGGGAIYWVTGIAEYKNHFAHQLRVRLFSVGGSSGTCRLRLWKNGTTVVHTQVLTYSDPPAAEHVYDIAAMTGGDLISDIMIDQITASQVFEVEIYLDVQ